MTLLAFLLACAPEKLPAPDTEICNGVDDDGNGEVDDGLDRDGDGYGPCISGGPLADCDDGDAAINAAAVEICDGLDNDCDGDLPVDERDFDGDGSLACEGALPMDCDDRDETRNTLDQDADGYTSCDGDCDDYDDAVVPGVQEACDGVDTDCDGLLPLDEADDDGDGQPTCAGDCDDGDPAVETLDRDGDGDPTCDGLDCDDHDPARGASSAEVCNERDDDCDGTIDEDDAIDATPYWIDTDGDAFGDGATGVTSCTPPAGYADNSDDCDDADAEVHPYQAETCEGTDNDCDGTIDEDWPQFTWYADTDADGFGNPTPSVVLCYQPAGYVADGTDCDDTDAAVFPGAPEYCNGYDDDCDGTIDEDDAIDAPTWYADADSDAYGAAAVTHVSCAAPAGYVADATDCDDARALTSPGASEYCNSIDDDCDGTVDEDALDAATWYADADGDAYGDASTATTICTGPAGYILDDRDCDDTNPDVHPGATEACNGIDDDCDGTIDEGVPETCNDLDDDCDGIVDDHVGSYWYDDDDSDGLGDPDTRQQACDQPDDTVANSDDCNDGVYRPSGDCYILFYDPSEHYEAEYAAAAGYSTWFASESVWGSSSTADFAEFDAIVIGDGNGYLDSELEEVYDSRGTWSDAIDGNMVVAGMDLSDHAFDGEPGAEDLLLNILDWVVHGPGTGLYVATDEGVRDLDYLSEFGNFGSTAVDDSSAQSEEVNILSTSHPVVSGLSDAELSNWEDSIHSVISCPSSFTEIAEDNDNHAVIVGR